MKINNRYGKKIDLSKLKINVFSSLNEHLEKIQQITHYLEKNQIPVEQNECYICGSNQITPFSSVYNFSYVECNVCSHVYTTKRYTEEAIQNFYQTNEYYSKTTYASKQSCYYRRENVAKPKFDFLETFINKNDDDKKRLLDVGAGIGDFVSVALEKGWQATGLEISLHSVKFAKEFFGVDLKQQILEKFYTNNCNNLNNFNAISFIGVLEHVVNPINHLKIAHNLLKESGVLLIQVPNSNSLTTFLQSVFPENVFRHMNPIEHIMLFSKLSIEKALDRTGFYPIAYWWHGMDIYELLNNLVLINKKVHGSRFQKAIMKNMNDLQFTLDQSELSDRIICVARKK